MSRSSLVLVWGEQNGIFGLDPLAFLAKVMGILKSLKFHNFDFLKIKSTTFLVHVKFQKEFGFKFGLSFQLRCLHFSIFNILNGLELESFMTTHWELPLKILDEEIFRFRFQIF